MAIGFMITQAGLDALVDAQNAITGPLEIAEVGITGVPFVMAPTLTAIPNEIKRIDAIAGHVVDAFTISMTARDASADNYSVTGVGLYLADGTLFAVWSAADALNPLFIKSAAAHFLTSFVVTFTSNVGAALTFADATFDVPPASETVQGVARRATQALALARVNNTDFITPFLLDAVLDALPASGVETIAMALADKFVTPAGLGQAITWTGTNTAWTMNILGLLIIKGFTTTTTGNASNSFTFAGSFPTSCLGVIPSQHTGNNTDQQDNGVTVDQGSITASGFSTFTPYDAGGAVFFLAIGR